MAYQLVLVHGRLIMRLMLTLLVSSAVAGATTAGSGASGAAAAGNAAPGETRVVTWTGSASRSARRSRPARRTATGSEPGTDVLELLLRGCNVLLHHHQQTDVFQNKFMHKLGAVTGLHVPYVIERPVLRVSMSLSGNFINTNCHVQAEAGR